ncbi:MAG: hypothetical protein H8D56_21755 [Planctomycetes bacterium]|nr:hypothetical protein [Planctomycetota bacterium]MBL7143229.1 hypothetical protein [Phycisphaerae bacterium]
MSNRIDFFQSSQAQSAVPAASVSIVIDGMLCPELEPVEIVHGDWPEFSQARLAYNPAAYPDSGLTRPEDIEIFFAIGRTVRIRQYFNGIPPGAGAFSFPLFHGQIENIETQVTAAGEKVEITARDFSAILKRVSVYGRRLAESGDSSVFLAGLDTVFNPDGRGNASATPITVNGKSYTAFCGEPSQGKHWSYAEVIDYILCQYLTAGQIQTPTIGQLGVLTENQAVRDLDVTGLNLIEALHRCCERIGLRFKFIPLPVPTGPSQVIEFYKAGMGRTVELNCQQAGEQLSISQTNIAALHSRKNFWPITHKYIGQGDFKIAEATFDLIKAWDGSLEGINYDKFSPSTNSDFYQVKDVYRKWCLNEAGDYSGAPYNQGDAFDFSRIFGSGRYARRRRRFRPTLTRDKQGKSLGYFLQVSFDNGLHWWQYLHAFNILLDECGLWLSSDQLDVDTWVAALKGVLKFRITASVISDERLTCIVSDGPVNSTAAVVEHIITLPRQFKYRKVSNKSIFANSSDNALGAADEVDDTDALYEFVRHRADVSAGTVETVDIQTPFLAFDYRVGDIVSTSPESRDLLSRRSDNRSRSRIVRVQMDFEKQCTNLKIVRQRS